MLSCGVLAAACSLFVALFLDLLMLGVISTAAGCLLLNFARFDAAYSVFSALGFDLLLLCVTFSATGCLLQIPLRVQNSDQIDVSRLDAAWCFLVLF